jgi:hypothetical protein
VIGNGEHIATESNQIETCLRLVGRAVLAQVNRNELQAR